MKKRVEKGLFVFALIILMFASVQARIEISNVDDIYSLGDKISVTVKTNPSSVSGAFTISLVCGTGSVDVYKIMPAEGHFSVGEEQIVNHAVVLFPEYIGNLSGNCNIITSLANEQATTNNFMVSKEVSLEASLDKSNYNPGDIITLNLKATKSNGKPLSGFVDVSGATKFSKAIEGSIKEIFTMPKTTESGAYTINLQVYDAGKTGEILNSANSSLLFNINQVPSSIVISSSSNEVMPGEKFEFGIDLYDQSGKPMDKSLSVLILSPDSNGGMQDETKVVARSGNKVILEFPTNATFGKRKIVASLQNIIGTKEFSVKELQKVSFEFLDTSLIITNIGNVQYNKTVDVKIGSSIQQVPLNLGIGEEKRFNLNAPNGEYAVAVNDGSTNAKKSLLLTGKAISVNETGGMSVWNRYPVIWTLIIIVLLALGIAIFFRYRKETYKFKDDGEKNSKFADISPRFEKSLSREEKFKDFRGANVTEAQSDLVVDGEKQICSVVSFKINNFSRLGESGRRELTNILEIIKSKKGVVHFDQNYILAVFVPKITRTFNNEIIASKTAESILKELGSYNPRVQDKIDFGIGVNSGELITALQNGKLRYTSIGSTVLLAKRISDSGHGKVLISSSIKNKLKRDVKTDRHADIGKQQVFSLISVEDKAGNNDKLRDLLSRMKK